MRVAWAALGLATLGCGARPVEAAPAAFEVMTVGTQHARAHSPVRIPDEPPRGAVARVPARPLARRDQARGARRGATATTRTRPTTTCTKRAHRRAGPLRRTAPVRHRPRDALGASSGLVSLSSRRGDRLPTGTANHGVRRIHALPRARSTSRRQGPAVRRPARHACPRRGPGGAGRGQGRGLPGGGRPTGTLLRARSRHVVAPSRTEKRSAHIRIGRILHPLSGSGVPIQIRGPGPDPRYRSRSKVQIR